MKIGAEIQKVNTASIQEQDRLVLKQGQTITGKIVENPGGTMEIITPGGQHIPARMEGGLVLPKDTMLTFQISGQREDAVILKLVGNGTVQAPSDQSMLAGLAAKLGMNPTPENLEFIKTGSYMFGRNMERLAAFLKDYGRTELMEKLVQIFISPDRLVEYMKGFNMKNGTELVQKLEELLEEMKKGGVPEEPLKNVMGSMLKGLHIQLNHPFPLLYIPIPIIIEGKPFNSELWIEKDKESENSSSPPVCLYLIINTPSLGRIDARITAALPDISVDIGCSRESISIFRSLTVMLEKRIASLGVNVKNISVSEHKLNTGFLGLVKKYIKPLKPLDIRV